jgi:hypothetical protein
MYCPYRAACRACRVAPPPATRIIVSVVMLPPSTLWVHTAGPNCVGPHCWSTLQYCVGPHCGSHCSTVWVHTVGPHCGSTLWVHTVGPHCGSTLWVHTVGPHCGSTLRVLTAWVHTAGPHCVGSHSGSTLQNCAGPHCGNTLRGSTLCGSTLSSPPEPSARCVQSGKVAAIMRNCAWSAQWLDVLLQAKGS